MQPNQPEANNGVPSPAANAWPQQPGPPQQPGFPPQPGIPQQPLYGAQPQPVYGMPVDNNVPAAYGQPAVPNYPGQNPGIPAPAPPPSAAEPKGVALKGVSDKLGNPLSSLGLGVFTLIVAFLFLNFMTGMNVWIKFILILILSVATLVFSLQAYKKLQNITSTVSLIISVWLLLTTVVVGSFAATSYSKVNDFMKENKVNDLLKDYKEIDAAATQEESTSTDSAEIPAE